VVTGAIVSSGLRCMTWRERDLPASSVQWQRPTVGPWRREQKQAALAAWLLATEMPEVAPHAR
jgi:hypothetical protein